MTNSTVSAIGEIIASQGGELTATTIAPAIKQLVGSIGSSPSGGAAGYDVTRVCVVAEQAVTTEKQVVIPDVFEVYLADIDVVGDLAQMFADGKIGVTGVIDGVAQYGEIDGDRVFFTDTLGIGPNQTGDGYVMQFPDTASTTHTVSVYYEDVTTTEHFAKAVVNTVTPKKIGALEYMGTIYISTNSNMSQTIGVNSGRMFILSKDGPNANYIDYDDDELLERYGEDYESMVSARVITTIGQPMLMLTSFNADVPSVSLFNNKNDTVTIDGNLNGINICVALFG